VYPEITLLFLRLVAEVVKILITLSEMGQKKKVIAYLYCKSFSLLNFSQEPPNYYLVAQNLAFAEYNLISNFRESIEGMQNIIWMLTFKSFHAMRKVAGEFAARDAVYVNWMEISALCSTLFPDECFSNQPTIEMFINMFENGPLIRLGNGDVTCFNIRAANILKSYKHCRKIKKQ
jgi:hypothetical protein